MMPCKNLLSDEPDSCMIRVGVPKNLVGVANGKLEQVVETDSEKIFHWKVRNPINIYNISFNVGDFVKLEKEYQDIHNMDHKIQIYALRYNQSVADTFYNQVPIILKKLENMFGIYPWWEDQCKIIETCLPHGLCMEHQSAISMTDAYLYNYKGFNFTLIHELSHEWWGNNVTAYDYGDLWLHEGFANYTEMLFLESLLGKDAYNNAIHYFSNSISNKRPIIKPYEVRYNCLVHKDDEDIYNKGALFLHTLRKQINNDSLFFNLLKETQTRYAKKKFTSNQFLNLVNEFTKQDYSLYFDLYLNKNIPPTLEFQIDKTQKDSNILSYKWKNVFSDNFKMNIPFFVGEQKIFIYPNSDLQQVKFPKSKQYFFDISQFGYILFKEETNK
ncbi:MAG: hypothetical protein HYR91_03545 [Flavobacteriia bacterium]|nr:hypothetical protein [Flavobacteriia bacterium]